MRKFHALALAFFLIGISVPASAQWVNYPDRHIPRTPDGKPNLTAPAPKLADGTPDFSGIWGRPDTKYLANLGADGIEILMQPWAEKVYKERQENNSKDWPNGRCLPNSVADSDGHITPRKIIQQPGLMVLLFEAYHYYRQIFTDGRPLPDEREPAWWGYSVGKWDRDTLVVNTVGLKEDTWLDLAGHPHSDALHIIERFRRTDFGHMEVEVTIDDPKAYRKPWTARIGWNLMPDTDLLDWVCENERDFLRLLGK
jgi:hypothetical protein